MLFPDRPVQVLEGLDNDKKPRQAYADRLSAMTEIELFKETEQAIWLSAYANNNPRSDYHWHASACWGEAERRDPGERRIYKRAFECARGSCS